MASGKKSSSTSSSTWSSVEYWPSVGDYITGMPKLLQSCRASWRTLFKTSSKFFSAGDSTEDNESTEKKLLLKKKK